MSVPTSILSDLAQSKGCSYLDHRGNHPNLEWTNLMFAYTQNSSYSQRPQTSIHQRQLIRMPRTLTPEMERALLKHRRSMARMAPEAFLELWDYPSAKFIALATGASVDSVYHWPCFGNEGKKRQAPKDHHLIMLAEADSFLLTLVTQR